MTRIRAPHAREEHLSFGIILDLARSLRLDIPGNLLSVLAGLDHRSPVGGLLDIVWSIEVLSVDQRIASVLLTSEIAYEGERIVRLVLIGRSLGA